MNNKDVRRSSEERENPRKERWNHNKAQHQNKNAQCKEKNTSVHAMNKKERENYLFLSRTFLDAPGNENFPRAKVVTLFWFLQLLPSNK